MSMVTDTWMASPASGPTRTAMRMRSWTAPCTGRRVASRTAPSWASRTTPAACAQVVEPHILGAAGMWPHSDAYLRHVTGIARSHGALVICDEVATGFGRTGDLFAIGGAGVSPDILVLGKGLSGGYLPLSATVVT